MTQRSEANLPATFSVGEAVQYMRHHRTQLSARALSLAAGQSESYVGKVENGEIAPSLRAFARLARVLGMSPSEVALVVLCEGTHETGAVPTTVTPTDESGQP